jgi:pectate lyase
MGEHSGSSEEERNQEVIEFGEKLREDFQSAELEPSYASIFSDPLMIDYMSTELSRIAQTYQGYYFDTLPEIIEKRRVNLPTGFFHVYGTYYSFVNLKQAISIGVLSSAVQMGDSYCKWLLLFLHGRQKGTAWKENGWIGSSSRLNMMSS